MILPKSYNFVPMKIILQKSFSVLMALLILASTVSWTVNKHLCMGRVVDVALFAHAEDCGMDMALDVVGDKGNLLDNHCCAEQSLTIKAQEDLKLSWNDLDLGFQTFLVTFPFTFAYMLNDDSRESFPDQTYPPPLIVKDIYLLHEVFLI